MMYMEMHAHSTLAFRKEKEKKHRVTHPTIAQTYIHVHIARYTHVHVYRCMYMYIYMYVHGTCCCVLFRVFCCLCVLLGSC